MTSEKFSKIRKSCKPHELRYFQEIHAISDDIDILWLLKCQFIVDDYFEDPSALKIYYHGCEEWLLDYLPTKQQASRDLAESCLSAFSCAMYGCKSMKRFRVEDLKHA